MTRKSSVKQERKEVQDAIDLAIREGRATLDEIVATVRAMGGKASRSAIGRYRKNAEEQLMEFRETQEMAKVWARRAAEEPDGDVAMLVGDLLKMVALKTAESMHSAADPETDKPTPPKAMDVMLLSKALDHLSKNENQKLAHTLKVREQALLDAAKTMRASGKRNGISPEVIEQIERDVLKMRA